MSKRRREDEPKPPMSALAARRLRSLAASAQHAELKEVEKAGEAPELSSEEICRRREEIEMGLKKGSGGGGKRVVLSHVQISSGRGGEAVPTSPAEATPAAEGQGDAEIDTDTEVYKETRMSNFTPTSENYIPAQDGSCIVRMTLVILGEYELCVRKGTITISGAKLTREFGHCQVFAPTTHALPEIACVKVKGKREGSGAEILVTQTESGVRNLGRTCPVANGIWEPSRDGGGRSFHPLMSKKLFTTSTPLPVLIIPKMWEEILGGIKKTAGTENAAPPVILLSGGKSVGKSTLSRILTNQLLTAKTYPGIYYLDVDPGQPSFTPPGFLSLHALKRPILGPPFTSPLLPKNLITAHHTGYTTPREDPSAYIRAILALLSDYRSAALTNPGPLLINSAGWVKSLGLELLQEIIQASCTTDIIYITPALGHSIPITDVLPPTNPPRMHVLESSAASENTRFTAADLRMLQTSSFMHYCPDTLRWVVKPLAEVPPWRLPYAGGHPAIDGVSILHEEDLSPTELLTAIDGTLVAIVEVDDEESISETAERQMPLLRPGGAGEGNAQPPPQSVFIV
ncbi:hypothetical protein C7212DRAFT_367157 [Tuber magnatum]|uniref:Polynucleotide 5'-hydroxyl-kinase GRC3 n=1 Tax=Tuber magnatum TaxID=42249 RepID=A0A317SDJ1_9PEZI|nr:hypothetical protein C7212DRAFT_367157 [Tuber magnatum]